MLPKELYIILVPSLFAETKASVFQNKKDARTEARRIAKLISEKTDFYKEFDYVEESSRTHFPPGKWIFYAAYHDDGSGVYVIPTILNNPIANINSEDYI